MLSRPGWRTSLRRYLTLVVLLCLAAGLAAAPQQTGAPAGVPSQQQAVPIFPLSQLKPGMKAVGYTVFQGDKVEEFTVEILGLLKNQWGPGQDVIVARVDTGRPTITGVAGGMSGSPIYIDGKLLGALSLRFGPFPNEPLAGITPAGLMLEIKEMDQARTTPGDTGVKRVPLPPEYRSGVGSSPTSTQPFLMPIETPLVFTGIQPGALEPFLGAFRELGVMPVAGGAGSTVADPRSLTDPAVLKKALLPGSSVSGLLLTGDLSAGGTGTVTYNDGRRVLAFGHPLLNFGDVDLPMAKAEIVTTFGSPNSPTKIANATEVVGTLRQDRHSGILGVLGESARMIPVEVTVHFGAKEHTYHFQVFQNPQYTPLLIMTACYNSLQGSNDYGSEATYRVNGTIKVDGLPDVKLNNLFTGSDVANAPPAPLGASLWIGDRFTRIFNNAFERPKISGVKFDFEVTPERRMATIDQVSIDRTEARPGEQINLKVYLRPYRGERFVKDVALTIPMAAAKGNLRIVFSDPDVVNRGFNPQPNTNRLPGLNEMISMLNREQGNGRLFMTVLEASPTGYVEDKVMPQLPASVANVIDPNRAQGRLLIMNESAILQQAIPVDYVVSGNQSVVVRVK